MSTPWWTLCDRGCSAQTGWHSTHERLVADSSDESTEGSIGLTGATSCLTVDMDLCFALPFACCSSFSVLGQMQCNRGFAAYWLEFLQSGAAVILFLQIWVIGWSYEVDLNSCRILVGLDFLVFLIYFLLLHQDDNTHERLVADSCDESTEGLKLWVLQIDWKVTQGVA